MPEDHRPQEPQTIDAADAEQLSQAAAELKCRPEVLAEAVEKVGPNRTAVKLYLTAPRA